MDGAVVTEWAEFLIFHAPGLLAFVLGCSIIASLAFVAGEDNEITRHFAILAGKYSSSGVIA